MLSQLNPSARNSCTQAGIRLVGTTAIDRPSSIATPPQAAPPMLPGTTSVPWREGGVNGPSLRRLASSSRQAACRELLASLRNDGPFTPPALQGTLVVPGNIGGAAWGGVAIDEGRSIAVVPTNRIPAWVQLFRAEGFNWDSMRTSDAGRGLTDFEYTRMRGTPYIMRRRLIMGPAQLPCTPPPFGALVAVSLQNGGISWTVPLGTMGGFPGSPNLGGPIATAGGVVFIGATLDRAIRAVEVETGRELGKADLPAGARATPMTYEAAGRQFVVIAAGGGGPFGAGDAIIAVALPK